MRPPNTPGSAGYVLGALIAAAVCGFALELPVLSDGGSILIAVVYLPIATVAVLLAGFPVMLAGAVVLQVLCFRVPWQAVHVVVAGLVGLVGTLVYEEYVDIADAGPDPTWVVVAVTTGAAVGRAAVIPLVNSRRRLAAEGRLSGTARW